VTIPSIFERYQTKTGKSYRAIAADMSAVLAQRQHPPYGISYAALNLWANCKTTPNAQTLEYLRDNASNPELAGLAAELLATMQQVAPALPAPPSAPDLCLAADGSQGGDQQNEI